MLPAPLAELEASEAVSPLGLGQTSLVAELLPWGAPAFLADLLDLRREIDATLRAAAPGPLPATYPAGACRPIRNQGLARLRSWPAADSSRPALQALARFRDRGGIIKGIWGIQKGVYFQNAIQAGDLWVDLANDTVDLTRPPVEVCQLGEARFEEVESFERFPWPRCRPRGRRGPGWRRRHAPDSLACHRALRNGCWRTAPPRG